MDLDRELDQFCCCQVPNSPSRNIWNADGTPTHFKMRVASFILLPSASSCITSRSRESRPPSQATLRSLFIAEVLKGSNSREPMEGR